MPLMCQSPRTLRRIRVPIGAGRVLAIDPGGKGGAVVLELRDGQVWWLDHAGWSSTKSMIGRLAPLLGLVGHVAVERVSYHSKRGALAKRAIVGLSEAAGGAVALSVAAGCTVERVEYGHWLRDVLGAKTTTKAEAVQRAVVGALHCRPIAGGKHVIAWNIRDTPDHVSGHVGDAAAIGLWSLGCRLGDVEVM